MRLPKLKKPFPIGPRTFKTALAVAVAMGLTRYIGATSDALIFAMLGAMAVVMPTFKESLEACITQIVGVVAGALIGLLLRLLPLGSLTMTWLGIILLIAGYHLLRIRLSPSLPCFILVLICITPDVRPIPYALGRIWDTAIGMSVGMLINILVFPYDNSKKIAGIVESLDKELILFLEDLFDGDNILPRSDAMVSKLENLEQQLQLFASQFLLRRRRQKRQLDLFRICDRKARELTAHLQVLEHMERPGRLNEENRRRLTACGAEIRDERVLDSVLEQDVVTNYHVREILTLRRELLQVLQDNQKQ